MQEGSQGTESASRILKFRPFRPFRGSLLPLKIPGNRNQHRFNGGRIGLQRNWLLVLADRLRPVAFDGGLWSSNEALSSGRSQFSGYSVLRHAWPWPAAGISRAAKASRSRGGRRSRVQAESGWMRHHGLFGGSRRPGFPRFRAAGTAAAHSVLSTRSLNCTTIGAPWWICRARRPSLGAFFGSLSVTSTVCMPLMKCCTWLPLATIL